ncbi:MAG: insulinase family protein [Lachnospiraceae bacterium]|nr:insulinase family protein [Lachnospiraceae bacterium]
MDLSNCKAYQVKEQRPVKDLNSEGAVLVHKKSGARVVLLSNDDDNKVFYIGFRTTPKNSTGVAHIMEHTVLCGSRKFPLKDPFVELAKGSLNTFLNAMTYPDKTVYPVASCNDKDFANLMDVYLDAVFYPNIYKEQKIFKQEGWHYEMEDADSELKLNGVVYNEMKGAFSNPDDVLDRLVLNSLYPENTYAYESGGDPKNIPDLTYEEYLDFHRTYYHPSNSYIFLYGNMDMEERLNWIDENYLSAFDKIDVDSEITKQTAFDKPKYVEDVYSITSGESEEQATYLSYSVSAGSSLDKEKYRAFDILDFALFSSPGAPVRQALLDKGIGTEVYAGYEGGIYQPYFGIVAKNADPDQEEAFIQTIDEELTKLADNGIPKDALEAALNYYEFKYREADSGTYPKGLLLGLQMFDSWLYDEDSPFMHVEANATFQSLREKLKTDYYERLIRSMILDNPHKVYLKITPEKELTTKREKALAEKLSDYKATLSKEEIDRLVRETKELKEYQETPDSPEALKSLPMLTRADLGKEAQPYQNEIIKKDFATVVYHDYYTNGVDYFSVQFPLTNLEFKDFHTIGILSSLFFLTDTEKYAYRDIFTNIFLKTGGLSNNFFIYNEKGDSAVHGQVLEFKGKVLKHQLKDAFSLLEEVILHPDFSDKKRILEILKENRSQIETSAQSQGHIIAKNRIATYFDEGAVLEDAYKGIDFYEYLVDLLEHFDERFEGLLEDMKDLLCRCMRKDSVVYQFTGERADMEESLAYLKAFCENLYDGEVEKKTLTIRMNPKKEGFMNGGQVQYVCRGGDFKKAGLPDNGALNVLRVLLGYDYLWINVRVKGGAYGCMSVFQRTGESQFVSYRDPNLEETIDIFDHAAEYLAQFDADEDEMVKYVIGAIATADTPLSPKLKGERSGKVYYTKGTLERLQRERDEMLSATSQTIRDLSKYVKAIMDQGYLCVVGSEAKLKEHAELFDSLVPIVK